MSNNNRSHRAFRALRSSSLCYSSRFCLFCAVGRFRVLWNRWHYSSRFLPLSFSSFRWIWEVKGKKGGGRMADSYGPLLLTEYSCCLPVGESSKEQPGIVVARHSRNWYMLCYLCYVFDVYILCIYIYFWNFLYFERIIYIYVYELVHNFVAWNITLVFGDIKKCFTEKLNDSEPGVICYYFFLKRERCNFFFNDIIYFLLYH